jgi:DNA-binding NarL/FixJ family response regulator
MSSKPKEPSTPPNTPEVPAPAGLDIARLSADEELVVLTFPLSPPDLPATLTEAERDVALRVLAGNSNAAIASARRSSERTVANQLARIYRKLGVASRSELARRLLGESDG